MVDTIEMFDLKEEWKLNEKRYWQNYFSWFMFYLLGIVVVLSGLTMFTFSIFLHYLSFMFAMFGMIVMTGGVDIIIRYNRLFSDFVDEYKKKKYMLKREIFIEENYSYKSSRRRKQ